MKACRYRDLIQNLKQYSSAITETSNTFGPSLYFHLKALEYQQKEFLSERHIEYVYATLIAWGMHRMGSKGAKMPNFDDFKESIIANKEALDKLRDKRIEDVTTNEIDSIIKELSIICFKINGSLSKSHLVSGSKTLAHILPNLVCPMDRQYTYRFFEAIAKDTEENIFQYVMRTMWDFYQNSNNIESVKPLLGQDFNENYPKIFDNLIIAYVHKNLPKESKKQKKS
jgi:hypothetical protein